MWVEVGYNYYIYFNPQLWSKVIMEDDKNEKAFIDKPFAYHKPSDDGMIQITRLRETFSHTKKMIEMCCPESRQRSVALTELETAAMWAIKAVVFNDPKSEVSQ